MKLLKKSRFFYLFVLIFVVSGCTSNPSIESLYIKSKNSDSKKKFSYLELIKVKKAETKKDYYYKILAFIETGEEEKAIELLSHFSPETSEEKEIYIYLKALKLKNLGFYELSNEFLRSILKSKNEEVRNISLLLYTSNLLNLRRKNEIDEKTYKKEIENLKRRAQKKPSWVYYYSIMLLEKENKNYREAFESAILSLELSPPEEFKKDIFFYISYMKEKSEKDYEKYKKYFEK